MSESSPRDSFCNSERVRRGIINFLDGDEDLNARVF